MKKNAERNSGSISVSILPILVIIILFSSGMMLYLSSIQKYRAVLERKSETREAALEIFTGIQRDMVNIREDEADSPFSSGVVNLKERYSLYNL
ncbi:MAG: hypothetical protein LBR47_04155, partial [Spirochaetaceae bacterium]|nr:hypothetical protein [Spirochaetaceae bacterium]